MNYLEFERIRLVGLVKYWEAQASLTTKQARASLWMFRLGYVAMATYAIAAMLAIKLGSPKQAIVDALCAVLWLGVSLLYRKLLRSHAEMIAQCREMAAETAVQISTLAAVEAIRG